MVEKILQINSVCGIRSTGRICTDIAGVLEKQGKDCKIAYGRESVPERYWKYAVRIGSKLGVKTHATLARLFDSMGFHSRRDTKKFIKWVKGYDPDVIHLHNLHGYYLNLPLLFQYLRKSEKKIVWTLHDCWAFTGHCSHFDFCGCEKWKNGCASCPQKRTYPKSILLDGSKRNYKKKKKLFCGIENLTIVTPSQWLAELVQQSFLGEYPVKVIHNGIDTNRFAAQESDFKKQYGIDGKQMVLGVATSWDHGKGLLDFYKLAGYLGEQYQVVLVGLTETQKKEIPANILGLERTNDIETLAKIYSAADVFVNMTYNDTYPTVNLEAQACGCPVVTYATGGAPETVDCNMENVVPKGNVELVASLIQSADFTKMFKKKAKSITEMVSDYINLYNED